MNVSRFSHFLNECWFPRLIVLPHSQLHNADFSGAGLAPDSAHSSLAPDVLTTLAIRS